MEGAHMTVVKNRPLQIQSNWIPLPHDLLLALIWADLNREASEPFQPALTLLVVAREVREYI